MKIIFLCTYYNRPQFLKNCLLSVLRSHQYHQDWELVLFDDNSPISGKPILDDILKDFLDRILYINSFKTLEEKLKDGLIMGQVGNEVISKSKADIGIVLCDDDQLVSTYPRDISLYFQNNPTSYYAYSHVAIYNPLFQKSEDVSLVKLKECQYNITEPVNPYKKLDSSQVAFRLSTFKKVKYPDLTKLVDNPDAALFQQLYDNYGLCYFTGLVAQYKGIHDYQLIWNKKLDLKEYISKINQFGIESYE